MVAYTKQNKQTVNNASVPIGAAQIQDNKDPVRSPSTCVAPLSSLAKSILNNERQLVRIVR